MEKSPEYFIQVDISLDHSEFMKTKLIFDEEDKVASCITSNQNIIPSLIEVDLASSNWDEEELWRGLKMNFQRLTEHKFLFMRKNTFYLLRMIF